MTIFIKEFALKIQPLSDFRLNMAHHVCGTFKIGTEGTNASLQILKSLI